MDVIVIWHWYRPVWVTKWQVMGSTTGNWFPTKSWISVYDHIHSRSGESCVVICSSSPGFLLSEAVNSSDLRPTHCQRKDRVDIYLYASCTSPDRLLIHSGSTVVSTNGKFVTVHAMYLRGGLKILLRSFLTAVLDCECNHITCAFVWSYKWTGGTKFDRNRLDEPVDQTLTNGHDHAFFGGGGGQTFVTAWLIGVLIRLPSYRWHADYVNHQWRL